MQGAMEILVSVCTQEARTCGKRNRELRAVQGEYMNQIDLSHRRAVVTGGAQGIGLSIARRLLASGASVSLWDRDGELLSTAQKELRGIGSVLI
jgi:NADP-dependent 3-hydroxy acid dehydrogenase YdfG